LNLIIAIIVGAVAGFHISTWGMYKDSIHEGFTWRKYLRSVVAAMVIAVILQLVTGMELGGAPAMVVFFGLVYAFERLMMELWDAFLRVEDQSKYFIPMQFGIRGKPVYDNRIRWSVGFAVLLVLIFSFWGVNRLQTAFPNTPAWLILVTIGSLGGWMTAVGGAWKDAPVEGFETFKFFRSPGISLFWAILVAFFTDNWTFIAVAGAGYSVTVIETYKTFFFPNKPRGKFAGKPILFPEMLRRRNYFVPVYVLCWILIIGAFVIAFMNPHSGLI
jgi:hypothetical protein